MQNQSVNQFNHAANAIFHANLKIYDEIMRVGRCYRDLKFGKVYERS